MEEVKKVHVPTTEPRECIRFVATTKTDLLCEKCDGETVNDINWVRDKYAYSKDIRGFEYDTTATSFKGQAFLGFQNEPGSKAEALKKHNGCTFSCQKWWVPEGQFIKNLRVEYERYTKIILDNNSRTVKLDKVRYIHATTNWDITHTMPHRPAPKPAPKTNNDIFGAVLT